MTRRRLAAGPLTLDYDSGDLRCLRLGDSEILRRVYVVFQDRNWASRPWVIEDEEFETDAESFRIRIGARGTFDAAPFTWVGILTGEPDGTVTYAIEGSTERPFPRNRLGLCVLHPAEGFDGRACDIVHPTGILDVTAFPHRIAPDQPFRDVRAMEYPVGSAAWARLDFDGEVFETEDHRNWSDASYKTYCTPISLPFPVEVRPGDRLSQSVTLTLRGSVPVGVTPPRLIRVEVSADTVPLPLLGTQLTGLPWSAAEIDAVRQLGLDHLLVTIDAAGASPAADLLEASRIARQSGTRLRVRVADADDASYAALSAVVGRVADLVDSWMVVRTDEKVTSDAEMQRARNALGTDLPWCAGTDLYFTELNRQPPDTTDASWVAFSLNPQVHSHDDRTVMQNTATQQVMARDIVSLAGDARIHLGPVSLRPRFNPNATDPASDVSSTALPSSVDARQRTWIGAAWTALALRSAATPGTIGAITYFEALGWRGLRERDTGSVDSAAFPSLPGEEFPVYALLRDLRESSRLHPTLSHQPEVADALVVATSQGEIRAFIANLDDKARTVELTGAVSATIEVEPYTLAHVTLDRRHP